MNMESRIIKEYWDYDRRWSLHDSDDMYVVIVSNGSMRKELTDFTKEGALSIAHRFISDENERGRL